MRFFFFQTGLFGAANSKNLKTPRNLPRKRRLEVFITRHATIKAFLVVFQKFHDRQYYEHFWMDTLIEKQVTWFQEL